LTASNAISSKTAQAGNPARNAASSSNRAEAFRLLGPSATLDPRINAYRRDLADVALAGRLFAPHYVEPMNRACGIRPAMIRARPDADSPPTSELLPGEEFAVLEISGHWAWGYSRHDRYVGYVEVIELTEPVPATHVVAAASAPILAEADLHAMPLATLPLGSRVAGHESHGFLATDSGFIPFTNIRAIDSFEHDPVAVAERLLGSPYLLGGRTSTGIDCSGLVQVSHGLCGIRTPRDSDQQRALGQSLADDAALRRGDLVFFEGHVGMMQDAAQLIHATGHHGKTISEPLAAVAARTAIVDRRRLS
jgi:hypothetical protein